MVGEGFMYESWYLPTSGGETYKYCTGPAISNSVFAQLY